MTVPVTDGATPGTTSPQRVEIVVSYPEVAEVPKRFPTPEEIFAAAAPALARVRDRSARDDRGVAG
ncbi:hypothetical protein [Amycolatopsis sp.]|uniref:hypothetical protein n=1 Tax=Amycolatopsis sp. TaxID=37632 RepID=UPI002E02A9DE|nr:hypothetical protein [Amycolatopsis sp.]